MKRIVSLILVLAMALSVWTFAAADGSNGKILYLSNLSSGAQYEFYVSYMKMICDNLGYKMEVVYADGYNDPQGNLTAVKNAYTSDVVGLIACQDGGLIDIMNEYPDLYVVGFFSDMDYVYNEDGSSHAVLEKDHFLGLMGDNYISGASVGEAYAEEVIARGYTKVATCIFPFYAYPKHTEADAAFRAYIEEYNKTAEKPIEIQGDATVLNFQPIDDSYFMEADPELQCIVGFCAGTTFIYPKVREMQNMGMFSDLQIITGGFDNDPDLLADCGDDKVIVRLTIAGVESIIWPIAMLDAAISGHMYADYAGPIRMDSSVLAINSTEKFDAMINNSPLGIPVDITKAMLDWDGMKDYFASQNPDATYQALCELNQSFAVEGYMK